MLTQHASATGGPAILGAPLPELANGIKFSGNLDAHVEAGEKFALASLSAELLVCKVSGVQYNKYIGRSQYPQFENKPSVYKNGSDDKFASPAANFLGCLR